MLVNLLKYEFIKKWKNTRYVALAYGLIAIAILIITRGFLWKGDVSHIFINTNHQLEDVGPLFISLMILFFVLAMVLFIFPFFESIQRFEKDLSGKQAVLELMIPAAAWKKITSKLITTVCSTIICGLISIFSIIIFVFIMSNFDKAIVDSFFIALKAVISNPAKTIYIIVTGFFSYASFYLLFFFCIAVSKSISHKNKIAVPISIFIFVLCIIAEVFLTTQAGRYPIATFNLFGIKSSLSSIILDILVFALTFTGTAWIMERRIES